MNSRDLWDDALIMQELDMLGTWADSVHISNKVGTLSPARVRIRLKALEQKGKVERRRVKGGAYHYRSIEPKEHGVKQ